MAALGIPPVEVRPAIVADRETLARLLRAVGWEERYVSGQLAALDAVSLDPEHRRILLAWSDDLPLGFVSVQFHGWNCLGQLQGLAVDPIWQRRGIASRLVAEVERFVQDRGGRGIYVDTPVTNGAARSFYTARGYVEDYRMTNYYDDGLDGVTYVKFFCVTAEK